MTLAIQDGTMPSHITRTRSGAHNPYVDALQDNITQTESNPAASKKAGPFGESEKYSDYDKNRNMLYAARKSLGVQVRTVREPHGDNTATLHFQVVRDENGALVPFATSNGQAEAGTDETETGTRSRSRR